MSQYGISPLHVPSDTAQVTILFVHGLRGKGGSTWTYPEKDSKPWPQVMLPGGLSKAKIQAKIMTFWYDADIVNFGEPAGQNTIAQHARNLLGELNKERILDGTEDVPILFVAHSLGGLVVKNALSLANRSPEESIRKIMDLTLGIIFMGTPHCGADAAKFAIFMASVTSIFRPTDSTLLGVLERDSEVLAIITSDFHEMLRLRREENHKSEPKMTCFFEELPMHKGPISHKIVDSQSAIIPGYQFYSIHADHVMMTKFRSENDPGYRIVLSQIIQMVRLKANNQPAMDAARDHWTKGTKSGAINVKQGNNNISKLTTSSGGGSMHVGNHAEVSK